MPDNGWCAFCHAHLQTGYDKWNDEANQENDILIIGHISLAVQAKPDN